jgi:hypothetical protein
MTEIKIYKERCRKEKIDITEIDTYLTNQTTKLRVMYDIINEIHILYTDQINSQVHEIADDILRIP